jgi:1-acyl-sn-glycerol-3-phosphate acyltransferase
VKEGLYAAYASFMIGIFAPVVWGLVLILPDVARRRRFLRAAARLLLRLTGLFPIVRGLEKLDDGGSVVVVNHQSYLDSLVLCAVLPARYAFVAKRELSNVWFAGMFLRALGTAFVERFDPKGSIADARYLAERLRVGEPMIAFPEGTFERRPGLRSFYLGAFMAAAEAEVPVIPIGIKGTRSALRADGWFLRRGAIEVNVGPAIEPSGQDWSELLDLRDRVRKAVLAACGEPDLASEPTWLENAGAPEET